MTNQDDQLLRQLARRNWLLLGILGIASLAWRDTEVTLGVVAGGLLAILGYHWRYRALKKLLAGEKSRSGFQFGYIIRLAVLGGGIFLLIAKIKVPPLALLAGLSVVVLNILWTTVKRAL